MAAVGLLTVTPRPYPDSRVAKYTLDWTADGSGNVSGHTDALAVITPGYLRQIKFVPNTSANPVLNLYDVTLIDENNVDLLAAAGANLSNTISTLVQPTNQIFIDGSSTLDLVVANASSGIPFGAGTLSLWLRL